MNMLQLTKAELDKHQALTPSLNTHLQHLVAAIPFETVPTPMKAVIAMTQLTSYTSQFRRNIQLWDGSSVPINAISFVVAGSGAGKDSAVKASAKCFKAGYDAILQQRESTAILAAQKSAEAAGEDPATCASPDIYEKYMQPLPPINIMPTTGPGLIQHINDIGDLNLSAGFLYSGEFSDELAYNPDMLEDIKILSELYDLGDKETKYTKGVEHRSKEISGQPISALLVGSPGHILYDEATKKKFHVAFMSKLARRSSFCYVPEMLPERNFDSIDELFDHKLALEAKAQDARNLLEDHVLSVATTNLKSVGSHIGLTGDVHRLFEVYKRYNTDLADSKPNPESTSALIRRHLQWKALKFAGALAIFDKCDNIELRHYIDAIRYCELLDQDMDIFERDLNKAPHERFSDFIRTQALIDNKATINVHDLKKNNYITSVSASKLQELVHLAAGYDTSGIYSVINEGGAIQYEPIIKTEVLGVSFKPIDIRALDHAVTSGDPDAIRSAKHDISVTTAYGYEFETSDFHELGDLLADSFAFSPFQFRNGVRGKDNIVSGTKWLILDIDDSKITASEAHFLLSDINHYVTLGSDPSNEYKFHVLIELDSVVTLSPVAWKHFYLSIAEHLGFKADPLPQSQIFFSYADRPILSNLDSSPVEARPFILTAKEREAEKSHRDTVLTSKQKQAILKDPLNSFAYAFESPNGQGSRNMYRMIRHAHELGATLEETQALVEEVNEYWDSQMPQDRLNKLLEQASRLY